MLSAHRVIVSEHATRADTTTVYGIQPVDDVEACTRLRINCHKMTLQCREATSGLVDVRLAPPVRVCWPPVAQGIQSKRRHYAGARNTNRAGQVLHLGVFVDGGPALVQQFE